MRVKLMTSKYRIVAIIVLLALIAIPGVWYVMSMDEQYTYEVMFFFNPDTTEEEVIRVLGLLQELEGIELCGRTTAAEALAEFRATNADDDSILSALDDLETNPLGDYGRFIYATSSIELPYDWLESHLRRIGVDYEQYQSTTRGYTFAWEEGYSVVQTCDGVEFDPRIDEDLRF